MSDPIVRQKDVGTVTTWEAGTNIASATARTLLATNRFTGVVKSLTPLTLNGTTAVDWETDGTLPVAIYDVVLKVTQGTDVFFFPNDNPPPTLTVLPSPEVTS